MRFLIWLQNARDILIANQLVDTWLSIGQLQELKITEGKVQPLLHYISKWFDLWQVFSEKDYENYLSDFNTVGIENTLLSFVL